MKKLLLVSLIFLTALVASAQEQEASEATFWEVNYFYGNIANHNNDILHLITGHPEGLMISWNRKTFGAKEWQQRYGYPDFGISFIYQDLKNPFLGQNYSLYGHYSFYLFQRNVMLRIGQGLAYTTKPYDKEINFRNTAFGTQIMSSTLLVLNYKKENIFDRFGFQSGFTLIHYSNANVKAPNTSINSVTFNLGVNYTFGDNEELNYLDTIQEKDYTEPIRYNFAFRTGVNESDVVDSGQYSFYVFSAYADKRLSYKSALQLGAEIFYSNFLKEFVRHQSIAFPERGIKADDDFKRVGVFAGHELFFNELSVLGQIGYYLYYPVDFEGRLYLRAGIQYYFLPQLFAAVTVKAHGAKAEAAEFSIGMRL